MANKIYTKFFVIVICRIFMKGGSFSIQSQAFKRKDDKDENK